MHTNVVHSILSMIVFTAVAAWQPDSANAAELTDTGSGLTREEKVTLFNSAAVLGVLSYGTFAWDYWQETPHAQSEEWFAKGTKHGGADKTGHFYTGYVASRISARLYESWGYDREDSATLGAVTSLLFTGTLEFGDSFSDFGFSPEDMIANTLGAGLGYLLVKYPRVNDFIDYRIEYAPSLSSRPKGDITTDYEHLKYMLAFRLAGFESLKDSPFRFIDILGGYYTRNYHGTATRLSRDRETFIGIGLDVAELLSTTPVSGLFRYVQLPYSYVSKGWSVGSDKSLF